MSLHFCSLSLPGSAFEPYWRKQSSRSFLVSGQAQHLCGGGGASVSADLRARRGSELVCGGESA